MSDQALPQPVQSAIDHAIDRIGDRFRGHPVMLAGMLSRPVMDAYQMGRHDALLELVTSEQAAHTLGLERSHIARIARELDIGWKIGVDRLFRPEDVEAMRQRTDRRRR